MNLNRVIIAGNLTRDPELRYTPKGAAVTEFGLAINRRWKDESGAAKEEATFVDVVSFGRPAETIAQYCKKGGQLLIEGRLKLDTWEDKQTGQKRSKLRVVAESFQFGARKESDSAAKIDREDVPKTNPVDDNDDVPF